MKRRGVTIVVHVDGQLASKKYRLPMWAFEAGKWGALVIGLLVVLFFTFAGPISRDAARAHILDREVARLQERLRALAQKALAGRKHRFEGLKGRLETLSPLRVLARGHALKARATCSGDTICGERSLTVQVTRARAARARHGERRQPGQ